MMLGNTFLRMVQVRNGLLGSTPWQIPTHTIFNTGSEYVLLNRAYSQVGENGCSQTQSRYLMVLDFLFFFKKSKNSLKIEKGSTKNLQLYSTLIHVAQFLLWFIRISQECLQILLWTTSFLSTPVSLPSIQNSCRCNQKKYNKRCLENTT